MTLLEEKQIEFARKLMVLLAWIYSHRSWGVRIMEVWRTQEQQKIYFKKGLTKMMKSKHLRCLAADIHFFMFGKYQTAPEAYRILGEFWENELGGTWGGRFEVEEKNYTSQVGWDFQHFEL